MGTCLSKKRGASPSSKSASPPQPQTLTLSKPKLETELHHHVTPKNKKSLQEEEEEENDGEGRVKKKKEIFIIKHRKSHEDRNVDAILLQCGRLSRNSSGKAASSSGRRRNYSASNNTSHDFDRSDDDDDGVGGENHHHHLRHHRRSPGACSDRRRRTPSRERDQHQRSNSRERRVSRSPSRRLSDTHTNNDNINNSTTNRPGKMVSVPPTVSSLCMDKSNNNGGGGGIKRISVKRNVSAASPRSQSPARASGNAANGCKVLLLSENQQQQQQPSLSRSSSRRAEQSPYRRNPLSEIDLHSLAFPQSANNDTNCRVQSRPRKESEADAYQKTNADTKDNIKIRTSSNKTKEQQEEEEEVRGHSSMTQNVVLNSLKPPHTSSLTRSRSSRRSRTDLDHILNPETLINPAQSYTSLLLEDIKNFHQKNNNNNNNTPSCSTPLPACVAKACSILEAVANLNSTSSSTILTASSKNVGVNHYGKRNTDSSSTKDTPFVESEVVIFDDVMEPSLHKYVTVTRDMEDKESSGSDSFSVSGQKHLGFSSSSLWEPNSGDSTDRWTCSTQLLSQKAHPRSRFI